MPVQRGLNISTPTDFNFVTHVSYDEESGHFIVCLSKSIAFRVSKQSDCAVITCDRAFLRYGNEYLARVSIIVIDSLGLWQRKRMAWTIHDY